MNYPDIINILLIAIGILVALTNIIVEVLKQVIPNSKFPTNIVAVVVAIVLTVLAFFAYTTYKCIVVKWYYVVGAVILGILVAYAAMFGFDKLKEIIKQFGK